MTALTLLVPAGAFLTVLLVVGAFASLAHSRELEREEELAPRSVVRTDDPGSNVFLKLGQLAAPDEQVDRETTRNWLAQAGFRHVLAVEAFYAARLVAAVAVLVPSWLYLGEGELATPRGLGSILLGLLAGYLLPWVVVARTRARRQHRIARAVPNMLDMLVGMLEAGQGIDASMRHVARQIGLASPELADELLEANAEMSAGIPRQQALVNLDHRVGVRELSTLVHVLGQAERLGAGIAPSIRAHAQLSRRRRVLEAEQRAARAAPILTVCMVVFILPALFVVLVGPTLVNVLQGVIRFSP